MYGFTGFLLLVAAASGMLRGGGLGVVGPLLIVFFGALLHIVGGAVIGIWLQEEESLRR